MRAIASIYLSLQKSYARSESHLTELLENVCKDISDNYVESKDPKTGQKMYTWSCIIFLKNILNCVFQQG